jgi:hypothetical protein
MPRGIRGSDRGVTMPGQDIYEQSISQIHRIGERLVIGDRVFRYASAGGALNPGSLLASATLGGALTTAQVDLVVAAATAGDTTLTVTTGTTAQPKDRFKDGYVTVVSDTVAHGAGQSFKIKSHPAQTAAGAIVLTLYDAIPFAITADCRVSMTANLWARVIETPVTTATGTPCGVPLVAVTSGYFFWCQTWGPCSLKVAGTVVCDSVLRRSLTAASADIGGANDLTAQIGLAIENGSSSDWPLSFLQIAP